MKKLSLLLGACTLAVGLGSCQANANKMERTPEAEKMLSSIKMIPQSGFMFGHQDDPVYGVGWNGDLDRSDVKSVCGDYPAMMAFDLGRLELGREANLAQL